MSATFGPTHAAPAAFPHPRGAPRLRANVAWALAGNAVGAGAQWAVLVVIARLADPAAVGRFALASAVTTPLFLLAGLQLRGALATDAGGQFRFPDYLGVAVAGAAVALLAAAGLAATPALRESAAVMLALALARAAEAVADLHHGLLQRAERMPPVGRSLIARGALNLAALGAVLAVGGGLPLAVLAMAATSAAVLLGYDRPVAAPLLREAGEEAGPRLRGPALRRIVATTLPLGVATLAVSLRTYTPRYFVEHRGGAAELGVFAALSSFVMAGSLLVSALAQSATPLLARLFLRGETRAFGRLVAGLAALGFSLGGAGVVAAVVAGRPLLGAVFGPAYAARADVLVWLMAAAGISYATSFVGYALTAARRFRAELWIFAATAAACALACAALVPAFGLAGAACAWGAALLAELVAGALVLSAALRARRARG